MDEPALAVETRMADLLARTRAEVRDVAAREPPDSDAISRLERSKRHLAVRPGPNILLF